MTAVPALLAAYLEAQADFGTDEVILPSPLARPAARLVVAEANPEPRLEPPPLPTAEPVANGNLFATLSQALAESAPVSSPSAQAARPAASRAESALPAFADLGAFWAHLAAQPGLAAGDPSAAVTCVVRGRGPADAALALVGLEPGPADAASGAAFQGEPGILLAKMLKAIQLDAEACYLTHVVKAVRAVKATRRDQGRLLPWLHAELALARAPMVLLLGEACAQAVLKTGKTLEELRQEPFRSEGREFAVTYHPADLLAREELKRKAWEDLQWLRKRMAEAQG